MTPVADTDPATPLGATRHFTPGIYRMIFVSPDHGFRRFMLTVPDNGAAQTVRIDDTGVNLAGAASGATVIGSTAGSLNAGRRSSTAPRAPTGPASPPRTSTSVQAVRHGRPRRRRADDQRRARSAPC